MQLIHRNILILFLFFIVTSCDGIFTRFSHSNYECQNNIFGIKNIWVTKKLQIFDGHIIVGDTKFKFDNVFELDNKIFLALENPELKLEINNLNNSIVVVRENSLIGIKCERSYFKM